MVNKMDENVDYLEAQEKTKLLTIIGCFFGIVIIGLLMLSLLIWFLYYLFVPRETQLIISESPNNKNKIEIVKRDDFPDPTLRIYYDNKSIMKTKLPDDISVEWDNDYEANVVLITHGRQTDIVKVVFKK